MSPDDTEMVSKYGIAVIDFSWAKISFVPSRNYTGNNARKRTFRSRIVCLLF